MFVMKKAISRRTLLRGVGVTVGLPLLDSMVPSFTALAATPAKPINRFGVVYVPNGMIMPDFLPQKEGPDYEITPTLSSLEPLRKHYQILSGLNCIPTATTSASDARIQRAHHGAPKVHPQASPGQRPGSCEETTGP